MNTSNESEQEKGFKGSLIKANPQLFYYALQLTEDRDDAKDLVQETNLKALKNYTNLRHNQYKNAWLYTILKNTHINKLRSGYHRNVKMNRADQELHIANAIIPDFDNPDRIFDRKELMEKIRHLPPTYSKPLKLFLSGYRYKEISNMTEIPIGTIKSRIHIAKEKLKKAYRVC